MKWLHISDLHYDPHGDGRSTSQLREQLTDYLPKLQTSVDEVFVTGDFRFAKTQPDTDEVAGASVAWVRELAAGVLRKNDPKHIHIVPGNHDITRWGHNTGGSEGETAAEKKLSDIRKAYSIEDGRFANNDIDFLLERFSFFKRVCRCLHGDASVWTDTLYPLHTYRYFDEYNIFLLYLNTAVACGGDDDRGKLVIGNDDLYRALRDIKARKIPDAPIIALAHHGLACFSEKERRAVENLLREYGVKLYLCGDAHDGWNRPLTRETVEITMGCLKWGNGAQAVFSIGELRPGGFFEVQTHRWDPGMGGWGPYTQFDQRIREALPQPPTAPVSGTKVFGRDKLIDEVCRELRLGRAVEVHGPAGIGKSTVCREIIKKLSFGTVTEVDLTQQDTIIPALTAILCAFNEKPSDTEAVELQIEALYRRWPNHTIYLDNMEDPLQDSKFKEWFFSFIRSSGWKILYSSRTRLIRKDILPIDVPRLEMKSAKDMFLALWGEDLPDNNQPTLETLLTALDCHPLSIHLITAQKWWLPTVDDLLRAWYENETHANIEFDDSDDRHRSLYTALYMSYVPIRHDREALTLWGTLSYWSEPMPRELFDVIFSDDQLAYGRAAKALLKNGLIELTKNAPLAYAMLAPIKNIVFQFDETIQSGCVGRMRDALITVYTAPDQRDHPDYTRRHHFALECLPSTLTFLRRTMLDDGQNKPLVMEMVNYLEYSASASLEMLSSLNGQSDDPVFLAFLFRKMGDLESRLGQIDAAISKYFVALGLYGLEQEPMGRVYCLAELCRAYAIKKDEPHFLEYAKATADALETVSENVASYAASCVREGMDIMGITLNGKDVLPPE